MLKETETEEAIVFWFILIIGGILIGGPAPPPPPPPPPQLRLCSSIVAFDRLKVICKHGGIPATLIANFHVGDVWIEALSLFVAHIT